MHNVIAYFFGLIKRVLAGEFRFWAGRKLRQPESSPASVKTSATPQPRPAPPVLQPGEQAVLEEEDEEMSEPSDEKGNLSDQEVAAATTDDKGLLSDDYTSD